jgi:putative transcriptional regulator
MTNFRTHRFADALRALPALLLLFIAVSAQAVDISKPLLLVASPDLKGPYNHTALIVVPAGDKHVGFIINRATQTTMGKLFPDHGPSAKVADPVFFGGPEASDAVFAMVRRNPGPASLRLLNDLYVTANAQNVDRIIETTPNDARYFVGFVGWQPGELAAEIEKGYWYVGPPDTSLVFQKETGAMWEQLVQRMGHRATPLKRGEMETRWTPDRVIPAPGRATARRSI